MKKDYTERIFLITEKCGAHRSRSPETGSQTAPFSDTHTHTHGVSQARGYTPDSLTHDHTHTDPDTQMDTPSHTLSHLKSLAETDTGLHWSTHTHARAHALTHARSRA